MWQQYVEVFIGQKCKEALIFNKQDGTPWAASPNFSLKCYKGIELKEDGSEVPADIDEEEGLIEFAKSREKPRHGFRINETKFQLLRKSEDGNTYYLKCKGGGAAVTVTERSVILGTWQEGTAITGPGCHQVIEELGKHLREHKY